MLEDTNSLDAPHLVVWLITPGSHLAPLFTFVQHKDEDAMYRKFPKYSDTQNICWNHSKIWTVWLYHREMSPNDAEGMANSVDPDQTAPLIWVCTVCSDLSVRKLRIITVYTILDCHTRIDCILDCNLGLLSFPDFRQLQYIALTINILSLETDLTKQGRLRSNCSWSGSMVFAISFAYVPHDKTDKMAVCPAKTRISLGIRPVCSESSLSAWTNIESLATYWVHSEDSDQTGWMPRLIWVLAGRTKILLVLSWGGSYALST